MSGCPFRWVKSVITCCRILVVKVVGFYFSNKQVRSFVVEPLDDGLYSCLVEMGVASFVAGDCMSFFLAKNWFSKDGI